MTLYAFDGTWNDRKDAGEYDKNTNVVRLEAACSGDKQFFKGIGKRYGVLGKWIGGAFGVGGRHRIRQASLSLFDHYKSGDTTIDIVGFSRGAALAVHFSNVIYRKGIRHPETGERIGERRPPIRFLGLFDVVAAFGIPINLGIPFHRINLGYRLRLPPNVEHCFHALAIDERRSAFRPTRVKGGYEVWFRGVHSDVGGGNGNLKLNDLAFRWMLHKASRTGVPVDLSVLDTLQPDPAAPIQPAGFDPIKNKPRRIGTPDRVHYTVAARPDKAHHNPPEGAPVESEEDEKTRLALG